MILKKKIDKIILSLFLAVILLTSISTGVIAVESTIYHGNYKSHIFHSPSCRYYNCKKCTVNFSSKEEAISKGYRACKVCKP